MAAHQTSQHIDKMNWYQIMDHFLKDLCDYITSMIVVPSKVTVLPLTLELVGYQFCWLNLTWLFQVCCVWKKVVLSLAILLGIDHSMLHPVVLVGYKTS